MLSDADLDAVYGFVHNRKRGSQGDVEAVAAEDMKAAGVAEVTAGRLP